MAYIDLPEGIPGIIGPMMFRPKTAAALNNLAEVLLRDEDNSLSRGERELIAGYVSGLNNCLFCGSSHQTFAALQLEGGMDLVQNVCSDFETADVSDKMKALLNIARKVQKSGKEVTEQDVKRAKDHGASDEEIHDAVLIAAAFCMFNRYVDGLNTWAPENLEDYEETGRMIVEHGYVNSIPGAE